MRIVLIVILILGLCTASFAAKPSRGRVTSVTAVDRGDVGETVVWWPPTDPTEHVYWEESIPAALSSQYVGVWLWFKGLYRIW